VVVTHVGHQKQVIYLRWKSEGGAQFQEGAK